MGEAFPQPLFCFVFNAFGLALTCQSVFIITAEKLLGPKWIDVFPISSPHVNKLSS